MRPILVMVFGPFILSGLAVLVLDHHLVAWFAGLVTGVCSGAWIALRDSPPAYVENWHLGADGERKTEKVLRPLEKSGLRIVHDVEARYGNYDHIAVGRTGVFLLETKNLQGIIEFRSGTPYLRRRLDPDAHTRCDRIQRRALAAAACLNEDIQRQTGHKLWVQAVVVFWADFPEGFVDSGNCVFVHGARLHDWMRNLPTKLDQAVAERIAVAVAHIASPEPGE